MSETMLGKGGFGYVERTQLADGSVVARKTLILTQFEDDNVNRKR